MAIPVSDRLFRYSFASPETARDLALNLLPAPKHRQPGRRPGARGLGIAPGPESKPRPGFRRGFSGSAHAPPGRASGTPLPPLSENAHSAFVFRSSHSPAI